MAQDEKLMSAIFNVSATVREKIHQSGHLHDFTHTEIETLKFLLKEKETTMKAISGHLHIKPPSTTSVVNILNKRGLIKRTPGKNDKRVVRIALTLKGTSFLKSKFKKLHRAIGDTFNKLSTAEKKSLITIFEKIHAKN